MPKIRLFSCFSYWTLSFLIILSLYETSLAQVPPLAKDYTGATHYLAPEGWTISTQQQNGVAVWLATQGAKDPSSPSLMVLAIPNQAIAPQDLLHQLLQENFTQLKVEQKKLISNDEAHLIYSAQSGKTSARIAACFLRDTPNNQMFVSFFAARPTTYQQLGQEDLLYQSLNQPNPYNSTPNEPATTSVKNQAIVQDPIAEQFGAGLNLQDPGIKQEILQNTATFGESDLHGEWTQIMANTSNYTYQEKSSGKLLYGTNGYAHLLRLKKNGQYELTYAYRNGPNNDADVVERGNYSLQDNRLQLKANSYRGEFLINGQQQSQSTTPRQEHTFQLGLHYSGKYLVLYGAPFDYTIATDTNASGQPFFLEGFYRTQ